MAQHRGVAIVEAGRVARRPRLHLSRSQRVLLDTRDRLGQHRPNHDNELLALYNRPLSSDEQRHTDAATAEALRTELRRAQRIRAAGPAGLVELGLPTLTERASEVRAVN